MLVRILDVNFLLFFGFLSWYHIYWFLSLLKDLLCPSSLLSLDLFLVLGFSLSSGLLLFLVLDFLLSSGLLLLPKFLLFTCLFSFKLNLLFLSLCSTNIDGFIMLSVCRGRDYHEHLILSFCFTNVVGLLMLSVCRGRDYCGHLRIVFVRSLYIEELLFFFVTFFLRP